MIQANFIKQIKNKPFLIAEEYDWERINGSSCTGSLTVAGVNTVSLERSPRGLAINQYIRISGGTGIPETCKISGISISGSNTTITITTVQTHSGAWKIESGSAGIKEAFEFNGNDGCMILYSATYEIYGPIILGTRCTIRGSGWDTSLLNYSTHTVAMGPLFVTADNLGEGTGGCGTISDFAIVGPGNTPGMIGWMVGGDGSGIVPSNWYGSFYNSENIRVVNCEISYLHNKGNFNNHRGSIFGAGCKTAVKVTGDAQPLNFFGCTLSTGDGLSTVIIDNPFSDISFFSGQVSGTISGIGINWKSFGTHYEPNASVPIFKVDPGSGSVTIQIYGGLISLHPGTIMTDGFLFSAASTVHILIDGATIQCDSGTTVTNFMHIQNAIGGFCVLTNLNPLQAGTFTNFWTIDNNNVALKAEFNFDVGSVRTVTPVLGVMNFTRLNHPDLGAVAILGGTTTITSVTGLRIGARGLIYSASGTIDFIAGPNIAQNRTLPVGRTFPFRFDGTLFWVD